MVDTRNSYRIFVRKAVEIRPLERPTGRCKCNSKLDLMEIGRKDGMWMEFTQDRIQ